MPRKTAGVASAPWCSTPTSAPTRAAPYPRLVHGRRGHPRMFFRIDTLHHLSSILVMCFFAVGIS
uniref:Uncharacterized protein n=1 Tax=Setaria italica TaxID=4555 RepID=K3XU64_SETIT